MIPLLVIAAWIVVLALVMGLCASAHRGDARLARTSAMASAAQADMSSADDANSAVWERSEHASINALAQLRTVPADAGASRVHSGGVAA